MKLFSIIALCLISSNPARALGVRDEPSQTVSLTQPSPTSTNPAVVSAYGTYSQRCGTDLNTATQEALKTYESVSSRTDVSIGDPDFLTWAANGFPDYMQATQTCQNALLDFDDAVASAKMGGASSSTGPGTSSATAPPSISVPPSQSSAAPPPSSAEPSNTPSSSPQPSPSKPAGAIMSHTPAWTLALGALAAVLYLS